MKTIERGLVVCMHSIETMSFTKKAIKDKEFALQHQAENLVIDNEGPKLFTMFVFLGVDELMPKGEVAPVWQKMWRCVRDVYCYNQLRFVYLLCTSTAQQQPSSGNESNDDEDEQMEKLAPLNVAVLRTPSRNFSFISWFCSLGFHPNSRWVLRNADQISGAERTFSERCPGTCRCLIPVHWGLFHQRMPHRKRHLGRTENSFSFRTE